ncbi:UvrD-helicase domain-containing protein [Agromyces tropicus]
MDDALKALAASLLAAAPASVEMPAGTGKTHLLAAAVATAADDSKRSLVLTHTNAGVDAIRKRLRSFGVPSGMARVETITSWAFSLVRAYPHLAGIVVAETPDWALSDQYVEGAARVAAATAIAEVHATSFDYVFVDEYQDCTLVHHAFITAIADAVPRTVLLGDRLQAIFGFTGALAEWDAHVLPSFPAFAVEPIPQRWRGHNEALGTWLLQVRSHLVDGLDFDFTEHSVPHLTLVTDTSPTSVAAVAHAFRDFGETVLLLDGAAWRVAGHASRLNGSYAVMEDINGRFMRDQINGNCSSPQHPVLPLPAPGEPGLARWFAQFAKACVIGLGDLNNPVLQRLERNQSLTGLSRDGIQPVVNALEQLRSTATYEQLAAAAREVRAISQVKVYRWEAWADTLAAIALSAENGEPAIDNFGRVRERLRRQGRKSHARIASRTLLVKGLEYDHVVIADLSQFRDPRHLYVALSRARKSVTVIGGSMRIRLQNDRPRA